MTTYLSPILLTLTVCAPQLGHTNILGIVLLGLTIIFLLLLRPPTSPAPHQYITFRGRRRIEIGAHLLIVTDRRVARPHRIYKSSGFYLKMM
jgi:hypothetical protein